MKQVYDFLKKAEVYYLKDATAQICSFTEAPIVIRF